MPQSESNDRQPERRAPAHGVLLRSRDCNGACALMEYEIPPRTLLTPLHTHSREDEYSYILSGTLGAQIGKQTITAEPHTLVAKTRGIPHTLWNPADAPTRVLELILPGGFDRCLAELHAPSGPPPPKRMTELWAQYGIEMHTASTPALMARHNLHHCALRA